MAGVVGDTAMNGVGSACQNGDQRRHDEHKTGEGSQYHPQRRPSPIRPRRTPTVPRGERTRPTCHGKNLPRARPPKPLRSVTREPLSQTP